MSPAAASGWVKVPCSASRWTSAEPCHPAATPSPRKSSMGPPPLMSCAVKPCRSIFTAASITNPTFTQCRSALNAMPSSATGCSRHSSAPASRPFTVILPAEPCQRLPEKSSATTMGGKKCAAIDAGRAATIAAAIAAIPMRMSGQCERDRAAGSALRRGERDAGIHQSRLGRAIQGDRLDGETMPLIERGQPCDQGVERSGLQLHAYAAPIGLSAAQGAGKTMLAGHPVDQYHRSHARVRGQLAAGGADLRSVRMHPLEVLALGLVAVDRARQGGMQRHQDSEHQDESGHGYAADGDGALLALLQTRIPRAQLVHRRVPPDELCSWICASTPAATGVDD